MNLFDVLTQYRNLSNSKRDMGALFERFIRKYLKTDPQYAVLFEEVWLWQEFPGRAGRPDTGIDLVAKEKITGAFWAIQCKFYDEDKEIAKADIDTFLSTSGKSFEIDRKEYVFSTRLLVSTTDSWSKNAEDTIVGQDIPVVRLRLKDLAVAPIDWNMFSLESPESLKRSAEKKIREHQKAALSDVIEGFKSNDRGKLIMACGTGKTYTSLKIAEEITAGNGNVLFLVPSISLLSQTLREWTADADFPLYPIPVCSDPKVSKKSGDNEDIYIVDLAYPATTDIEKVAAYAGIYEKESGLKVIFSTYQSIAVIADAQKQGLPEFDIIICDEAHRTTGVTLSDTEESAFVRVHNNEYIKAKKRLYMTATPRIYGDASVTRARDAGATLASMDDKLLYGPEFHRLGFGEAVNKGLLSDYRVLVLAVDEKYIARSFQAQISDNGNEMNMNDNAKIIGCWNGLSKKIRHSDDPNLEITDTQVMKRAVAFCGRIADSMNIARMFDAVVTAFKATHGNDDTMARPEVRHVDGTFNALQRNEMLDWLREQTEGNTCRILTNARCLSEGVDVPSLDAVMFLAPRKSITDVVQSVGRVMRVAEGKEYGYVILPIPIPSEKDPAEALNENEKYRVVWEVLQALRAHDDRFNSTINKIDLNKNKPEAIQIIGIGFEEGSDNGISTIDDTLPLPFPIEEWQSAIYAKIVDKCGSRLYWETWANDVAAIAQRHIERINLLLEKPSGDRKKAFDNFLEGIRQNLNPQITEKDAVEMLAQHLITKPVFDALFEGYSFVKNNPVSQYMEKMLTYLEEEALEKETKSLDKFYESVKIRAEKIDNMEGRQKVIIELYNKFFKAAFPKMAEKLGMVFTPVEVVDFIINSVEYVLNTEFETSMSEAGVHILDPFTGTGTFIVRLIQSGIIRKEDLLYKYTSEIHANEIVLLAYYIAAINIEEAFHRYAESAEYVPFEGIVLADTFQMTENDDGTLKKLFPENSERAERQNRQDIRVIIGNPPYSVGQGSQNDNNRNVHYAELEKSITATYALYSKANKKNGCYDSYMKAFRWASNRIAKAGVICFVTNASFIDANDRDGFRKCAAEEFNSIYVFNLRGDARSQGEQRRKESGNVFGEGSRTPVAVSLLIKNPDSREKGVIRYYDIGDYLDRGQKLDIIRNIGSIEGIKWNKVVPNENYDWINPRNELFETFIPMDSKNKGKAKYLFEPYYSLGIQTNRDPWVYNFNKHTIKDKVNILISTYNKDVEKLKGMNYVKGQPVIVENLIERNPELISWSSSLIDNLKALRKVKYEDKYRTAMYRPFCKEHLYYGEKLIHRRGLFENIYPTDENPNLTISITGVGASNEFSALIVDMIPNLDMIEKGQNFPLYYYEKPSPKDRDLYSAAESQDEECVRHEAITDWALNHFRERYKDVEITKEDIFYYIYGIFHSEEYKTRFKNDLSKMLPRIPFAANFWAFSKAGRELADWHLNYETVDPYPLEESGDMKSFVVEKMRFAKKGKEEDRTTIVYNAHLTLSGIPLEGYNYVVNGKPAIRWIMERYQVKVDKASGIKNDPNDWSDKPRYIVDLLKRIVWVSLETMKIVKGLPELGIDENVRRN